MTKRTGVKTTTQALIKSILVLFLFWPQQAIAMPQRPGSGNELLNIYSRDTHPKTQSILVQLMNLFRQEGLEKAQDFARSRAIEMDQSGVRVVVEASSFGQPGNRLLTGKNMQYVSNLLTASGAKIETTFDNMIQTQVPLEALVNLQESPWISKVRLPLIPRHCVISEGVEKVGALEWMESIPYKTEAKAKICVLDDGFTGYPALLGTELPASVVTKSFRADGNLYTNEHGTACAEIIYDIAPNAEYYFVNIGTDIDFLNAVNWIVEEEIDIVSCSLSWVNAGAGDGTGPIDEAVKWAHQNGIIWVNSAGNDADNHWMGIFYDPDSNGYHNFSGGDEFFSFHVTAGEWFGIFINWNDWGSWNGYAYTGSNQDFDLLLYYWNGSSWDFIFSSANTQSGYQWPIEEIGGYVWPSGLYGIAIHKFSATRNVKFDLKIWGATSSREYNVPEESMGIPADSPYALAVGATGWSSDSYHYYSSRGPTKDGRIKPDLTAPSGVSTVTYGYLQFYGTSSSAPLVAGACALLKANTPLSPQQIVDVLEGRAKDLGEPGKDNLFGSGRLKLNK